LTLVNYWNYIWYWCRSVESHFGFSSLQMKASSQDLF